MESSTFNLNDWLPCNEPLQGLDETTIEMDIERVTCAIEASHTDLTGSYQDWLTIGFALANELGEMGRSFFHRLSRFHPGYSLTETDKKYDSLLKGDSQGTTIKSFFYLAKQAGIEIARERPVLQTGKKKATEDDEPLSEEEFEFNTPRLPEKIYENLPRILAESTRLFADGIERDIFFLSALTVLSSCLPQLEGMYFNRNLSPHLYLFIIGPSASGKGTMIWSRYLPEAIHEEMTKETAALREAYKQELSHYEGLSKSQKMGVAKPIEPARKMFYIPANCSSSALTQLLAENNFRGLIFETEADTMANAAKQDWGDSSDIYRKSFHHENTSMARRRDKEFLEITNPHLAMCLSGTPKQVHKLMPEVENGLFSRFMYYAFHDKRGFLNPFVSYQAINYNLFFTQKSYEVFHLYDQLRNQTSPLNFHFSDEQALRFTSFFSNLLEKNKMLFSRDLDANTKRLGVITFRIAMTLSGLRLMELEPGMKIPQTLLCTDQDFQTAMTIATTLETHAAAVYQQMPKINMKGLRLSFYEKLPNKFDRQGYLTVAKEVGISPKTAEKYLGIFKEKLLDHVYNEYSKKI